MATGDQMNPKCMTKQDGVEAPQKYKIISEIIQLFKTAVVP